jgi:hypothetical protein
LAEWRKQAFQMEEQHQVKCWEVVTAYL